MLTSTPDVSNPSLATENGRVLRSLESLRIVAAIMVMFAHSPAYQVPVLKYFLHGQYLLGSIGVDLFFVISGVVIGLSVINAKSDLVAGGVNRITAFRKFMIARFFRVYPLYWIMSVVWVIVLVNRGGHFPSHKDIWHSLTLLPYIDNLRYADPVLLVGWTLRFEIFFYAVCGLGVLAGSIWLPLILVGLCAFLPQSALPYFSTTLVFEFLFGYVMAVGLKWILPLSRMKWLPLLFFAGAIVAMVFAATGKDSGYPIHLDQNQARRTMIAFKSFYTYRWIAWGLPAASLVLAALALERRFRWRLAPAGKYTYSLYLIHTLFIPLPENTPPLITLSAFFAMAFMWAVVVTHLLERPLARIGRWLVSH